jgi:hypothetical protein
MFQKPEVFDLTCLRMTSVGQEEVMSDFPIPRTLVDFSGCGGTRIERLTFDLINFNSLESNRFVS